MTAAGELFYIENKRHGCDCRIWWRPNGHGYTRNLDDAGRYSKADAERICSNRPEEDKAWPVAEAEAQAVRHVPV